MRIDADIWSDYKKPFEGDLKISFIKCGRTVKFALYRKADGLFTPRQYIEVSDVQKLPERIYFRTHDGKINPNVHKITTTTKSSFFIVTPGSKAKEDIYRDKWVGKGYTLKMDEECGLYYIECEEGDRI